MKKVYQGGVPETITEERDQSFISAAKQSSGKNITEFSYAFDPRTMSDFGHKKESSSYEKIDKSSVSS